MTHKADRAPAQAPGPTSIDTPTTRSDAVSVTRGTDRSIDGRLPCRLCKRRTRPIVPVSQAGWDLCVRCFRGVTHLRRYSAPPAVEAWARRVEEIAEQYAAGAR
jgi:hypothetical protein